jgi:hypothetical protein
MAWSLYGAFRIWRGMLDPNPEYAAWAAVCLIGVTSLALGIKLARGKRALVPETPAPLLVAERH